MFLVIGPLLVVLPSCQQEETSLPPGLSAAYADLLSYRSASGERDSTRFAAGVDSILALHGFDRSSFRDVFRTIGSDPDQVNAFFDSTAAHLIPKNTPPQ